MSNVIPFPDRKSVDISDVASGTIEFGSCTEVVHYFSHELPAACNCGERFWEPPSDPVARVPDAPPA